jgi:hypothetical protein
MEIGEFGQKNSDWTRTRTAGQDKDVICGCWIESMDHGPHM